MNSERSRGSSVLIDPEQFEIKGDLPAEIVQSYLRFSERYQGQRDWRDLDDSVLWGELCLCILSSNVQFETAVSALRRLLDRQLLTRTDSRRLARSKIAAELARPVYLPPRKNGSLRKYRFPNVRASNLASAWDVMYREGNGVKAFLMESSSVDETRLQLAKMVPGIGLKEASHFMRNVKFADSVAIIDTHIVRFLREYAGLELSFQKGFTSRDYFALEDLMRKISGQFNLSLAALDMAIWDSMRRRVD